jgi:hypothetical protein
MAPVAMLLNDLFICVEQSRWVSYCNSNERVWGRQCIRAVSESARYTWGTRGCYQLRRDDSTNGSWS